MRMAPVALVLLVVLALAAPASAAPAGEPVVVYPGLETPWDVVQPGDGRTLVVERPGRIRVVETGQVLLDQVAEVDKFLGLVAHPAYASNKLLYLYVNDGSGNKIVRLRDDTIERTIFSGIATDGNHDGGRMAFGPDGHLYVTTGDVHDPARPQDLQSLNGKILRLLAPGTDADGEAPADNPFFAQGGNARFVWSYGHRHPQGLVFDAAGRLYESEHGPTGETYGPAYPGGDGRCCRDEVNLIEKGGNYGWPLISGDESAPGLRAPIATSGGGSTWAPGGLAVGSDGHLYMPALAGAHLRELSLSCDGRTVVAQTEHYKGRFGRLRAATAGTGGLYFTQDGGAGALLRVPLEPPAPCPAAAPAPAATGPPAAVQPAAMRESVSVRTALGRLLTRAARDVRHRGLRARRFRARAGGFTAGRLTLRLQRRRGRPRTLAIARRRVVSRRTVTLRPRLRRTGRRVLRERRRARLVLVAIHRSAEGARTSARKRVLLRRQ